MSNPIIIEEKGPIVIIRFNRPEMRNPLSIGVLERLSSIIDRLDAGGDVRRVIFTGVDDVFASGADLREVSMVAPEHAAEFARRGQHLIARISRLKALTIAAINGICFGGALDLALACGRRIASPDAAFAHPGANLGIITGWGGTQRLPRLIGEGRALEMLFTARRIMADEALAIGLVDEIATDPLFRAVNLDS